MTIRGSVRYTARRSLAPGHIAGETYVEEFDFSDALPSVEYDAERARSLGGATETTFYREDVTWTIEFAPVSGFDLLRLRELLDSIESGHSFFAHFYGDEEAPIALKRVETEHAEQSFMRMGSCDGDWFIARISAIEAAPGDQTDTIDVYAPGTAGALDPAEALLAEDGEILTAEDDSFLTAE